MESNEKKSKTVNHLFLNFRVFQWGFLTSNTEGCTSGVIAIIWSWQAKFKFQSWLLHSLCPNTFGKGMNSSLLLAMGK